MKWVLVLHLFINGQSAETAIIGARFATAKACHDAKEFSDSLSRALKMNGVDVRFEGECNIELQAGHPQRIQKFPETRLIS